MATSTALSSRRGLGGFATLAGGALMIVSVFLPWFGGITGWASVNTDLASIRSTGDFYGNYAEGFSPFFTGLSILIAGGLLVLIGLFMLASLRGGAFHLPAVGKLIVAVLAIIIVIVGVTNLASLYATSDVDPEYGLFILTAGALIGFFGVVGGMSGRDS